MENENSKFSEYTKHYTAISFNVRYSYAPNDLRELFFAAQPLEALSSVESSGDFMYGKIDRDFNLRIGLKEFQITMTKELHERMGALYDEIRNEYVRFINTTL
ncbi:hypothetical protein DHD05_21315 [Arenibacter sp. N53]|uniref:hypothetical protein n=1 Tax=Arenibacter TaxID=178469 RepID=UPI000CD40F13|nr:MULTISPECIES: hypothetical protein [Arenibacter]MCM4154136.1 hypothetical protein [Arenibacter sp. N53]